MSDFITIDKSNSNISDYYVDFCFDEEEKLENNFDKEDSLYEYDGKKIIFDDQTMFYYRAMRYRKMDPIILTDVDENKCFKFYYQWNPYNGERLGKDPYGPLCFHPDTLIKYYYENRLNNLWVNEIDQDGIQYEGYYDEAVGAGFDIYIQSRGYNPDKYLFRLPIHDCYLVPGMEIAVTMGPVLTDEEVKEIDELATKYYESHYYTQYGVQRPSLYRIKQLYDIAVSKKPPIAIDPNMSPQQINELYAKTNRNAVDKLKIMKG